MFRCKRVSRLFSLRWLHPQAHKVQISIPGRRKEAVKKEAAKKEAAKKQAKKSSAVPGTASKRDGLKK